MWQKVYSCEYAKVYSCIIIDYCIIFHTNCKPTFAPLCIFRC